MLGDCDGVVMLMPIGADGVLGIAGGIETSLTAAKLFGMPVWAALSTSGMIKFAFPPGLRRLTIFAGRGEGGEKAAVRLRDRALMEGIEAAIVLPRSEDDFNEDLRRGHAASDYAPPMAETPDEEPGGDGSEGAAPRQEIIAPPCSFDDIVAAAQQLTRPSDPKHLTSVLRGVAIAKRGGSSASMCSGSSRRRAASARSSSARC